MNRAKYFLIVFAVWAAFCVLMIPVTARADIISTGNVDPTDPIAWDSSTMAKIGYVPENDVYDGIGSVTVNSGSDIVSTWGYIGYDLNSSGTATVSGDDSTWTNESSLYVGHYGDGTLSIANGGSVSDTNGYLGFSSMACCIGYCSGSTGKVTVSDAGSTLITASLYVGHYGDGTLSITSGGSVSNNHGYIGHYSGSTGEVTVSGSDSIWTNSWYLYVGYGGDGTLTITDGGKVFSNTDTRFIDTNYIGCESGSTGKVTVSGSGSTWTGNNTLCVGDSGDGTLLIADGGSVSCRQCNISSSYGTTGKVTVSDTGSTLTSDGFLIGGANYSDGTLSITGGGSVSNYGSCRLGSGIFSKSEVTVSGTGSTLTNGSCLYVGYYGGDATLSITDGGSVSNTDGYISYRPGSTGNATVSGTGSTWTNSGNLYIGPYGDGALSVTDGGRVSDTNGYIMGYLDAPGKVTVSGTGSTWTSSDSLYVSYHGDDSMLLIIDGGSVSNTDGYIGYSSYGTGEVTVSGTGSTLTNSDSLYVGYYGNGMLSIADGGLVSVAGTLAIDYDGYSDSWIKMSTGGMLALYGEAYGSLSDFLDLIEGSGDIRYYDEETGGWESLTEAFMGTDYTLSFIDDGDLDGYTLLTVYAVPEPGTFALLATGLGILLACTCRKRKLC